MPRTSCTFTLVTDPAEAQARVSTALVAREPEALSVVASVTQASSPTRAATSAALVGGRGRVG